MDESVVKHLERPQVGTLKLSEAIRIGARIRPQCAGAPFVDGRSCAWGAAAEGMGHPYISTIWSLGAIEYALQRCQVDKREATRTFLGPTGVAGSLIDHVWRLNDSGWTRESIADWLQSIGY